MGAFEHFPYTNFHELNLDFIISKVKEYINKTEGIEIQIKMLSGDLDALKEYVNDYFDSLDLKQAVSDKIDEMLDNGELEAIINANILNYSPLSQEFAGSSVFRVRENYYKNTSDYSNSPTCGFQNATVYSPSNDYSSSGQKYAYAWKTWSDDSTPELITIDINNNAIINRLSVANGKHGGPLCVYDGKLYSINNDFTLFIFDLSNITAPALMETKTISGGSYSIAGHNGNEFILVDNNKKVYKTVDFINILFMFNLQDSNIDITQDYHYDHQKELIYRISFRPSVIHIYSALTGEKITTMRIPSIINYIAMAEPEAIFVFGNHIYFGAQVTTGIQPTTQLDFNIFYEDINNRNTGREVERSVASLKTVYVDYTNGDPLNKGVETAGNYTFKYFEDALNIAKDINELQIVFRSNYPESLHIFADVIVNFDEYSTGAIKVDENRIVILYSLSNEFIGPPIEFTRGKTFLYIGINARVTMRTITNITTDSDVIGIWAYRSELIGIIKQYINNVFIDESRLQSPGIVGTNFYANSAIIDVLGVNANNWESQFISADTMISGRATNNLNDRFYLDNMKNYKFVSQGTFNPSTGAVSRFRPVPPLQLYLSATGSTPATIGYWSAEDTYTNLGYTVFREEVQSNLFGLTAIRYSITEGSNPFPHLLGVFNYQK